MPHEISEHSVNLENSLGSEKYVKSYNISKFIF